MSELLPRDARCVFDAETVDVAVDRIAVEMALKLWDARPVVVCLMNGGLPFTADLLRRFHFDLELDYLHLSRYEHTTGGDIRFVRRLERSLKGRTVLLVDDVLDAGETLAAAQREVNAAEPEELLSAVLVRKDTAAVAEVDYAALQGPNEFLVGRGMDCDGAFRQLSGIYALPPDWPGTAP
ncbi:MAG: phosphoribosyltransferase family protein [Gammaproteobacteria bacterium]|nr:phosphoribosyltransferase family protein [Gammaproteobacteria bacterium]